MYHVSGLPATTNHIDSVGALMGWGDITYQDHDCVSPGSVRACPENILTKFSTILNASHPPKTLLRPGRVNEIKISDIHKEQPWRAWIYRPTRQTMSNAPSFQVERDWAVPFDTSSPSLNKQRECHIHTKFIPQVSVTSIIALPCILSFQQFALQPDVVIAFLYCFEASNIED